MSDDGTMSEWRVAPGGSDAAPPADTAVADTLRPGDDELMLVSSVREEARVLAFARSRDNRRSWAASADGDLRSWML